MNVLETSHMRLMRAFVSPRAAWRLGAPELMAHDAGAATHILAWHRKFSDAKYGHERLHFRGPAYSLATAEGIIPEGHLRVPVADAQWALVGTGWQSAFEVDSLAACAAAGVPALAVLDHWVNYRRRFAGLDHAQLPFGVVVTDSRAQSLAKDELPWARIFRWPNTLSSDLRRRVKVWTARRPTGPNSLLWVSEPIRPSPGVVVDPLLEKRFADVIWPTLQSLADANGLEQIVVRRHPSEASLPRHRVPKQMRGKVRVSQPGETELAFDLARSSLCLGLTTYALYLAAEVGLAAFTLAPYFELDLPLPSPAVRALALDLVVGSSGN